MSPGTCPVCSALNLFPAGRRSRPAYCPRCGAAVAAPAVADWRSAPPPVRGPAAGDPDLVVRRPDGTRSGWLLVILLVGLDLLLLWLWLLDRAALRAAAAAPAADRAPDLVLLSEIGMVAVLARLALIAVCPVWVAARPCRSPSATAAWMLVAGVLQELGLALYLSRRRVPGPAGRALPPAAHEADHTGPDGAE
jgi:hypothetical protein